MDWIKHITLWQENAKSKGEKQIMIDDFKPRVYLDASVVSYLCQDDAPERKDITHKFWSLLKNGKYIPYLSNVTVEELQQTSENKQKVFLKYLDEINPHYVEVDENALKIANKIVDEQILTKNSFDDCRHIAGAIKANCDIIASWNFKHLVNFKTNRLIRILAMREGYKEIIIYSPESLLMEDTNND